MQSLRFLMMFYLLCLLFLLIPSLTAVETAVTKEVYKYTQEVSKLAAPTLDWLEHLQIISTNASRLLKMAGPVSSLVAAGLDAAFGPKSPELQAIEQLNEHVIQGFDKIDTNLQQMEGRILYSLNLAMYGSDVKNYLDQIKDLYRMVTNSNFLIREQYKDGFINGCKYGSTKPNSLLQNIRRFTKYACPMPSKRREKKHNEALEMFNAIENSFNQFDKYMDNYYDYHSIKKKFLSTLFLADKPTAYTYVLQLQTGVHDLLALNETTKLSSFISLIEDIDLSNEGEGCILNSAFVANEDRRSAGQLISEVIAADVVMILDIAGVCANASFNGSIEAMEEYKEAVRIKALEILDFNHRWLTKKLEIQWPVTQLTYAFNNIKEIIPVPKYTDTAQMIGNELLKRGLPGYHYHVLVSDNWVEEKYYYGPVCFESNCNGTMNYKGINIATFRQFILPHERAISARNWNTTWSPNITDIISRQYKTTSLRSLAQIIDGAIDGILQPHGYGGYVFIRNIEYWESKCIINYGNFTQSALTEPAMAMIPKMINKGITEDAYLFNLFLFL